MSPTPDWTGPTLLPVREQARVVNDILLKRFETLLPRVMRETDIDTWLIVCHEDNHDPVFRTMIPWQSWTPILHRAFSSRSRACSSLALRRARGS